MCRTEGGGAREIGWTFAALAETESVVSPPVTIRHIRGLRAASVLLGREGMSAAQAPGRGSAVAADPPWWGQVRGGQPGQVGAVIGVVTGGRGMRRRCPRPTDRPCSEAGTGRRERKDWSAAVGTGAGRLKGFGEVPQAARLRRPAARGASVTVRSGARLPPARCKDGSLAVVGAAASVSQLPAEGIAVLAALLTQVAGLAPGAFVDGVGHQLPCLLQLSLVVPKLDLEAGPLLAQAPGRGPAAAAVVDPATTDHLPADRAGSRRPGHRHRNRRPRGREMGGWSLRPLDRPRPKAVMGASGVPAWWSPPSCRRHLEAPTRRGSARHRWNRQRRERRS